MKPEDDPRYEKVWFVACSCGLQTIRPTGFPRAIQWASNHQTVQWAKQDEREHVTSIDTWRKWDLENCPLWN